MVMEIANIENEISFMKNRIVELELLVRQYRRMEYPSVKQGKDPYQEVTIMLLDLGIPAHIQGYRYLREAILLVFEEREILGQITKTLYPTLADQFKTTASRVERAIRHAIEVAYSQKNTNVMASIFGFQPINKPTNSEFIAMVVDVLAMNHRGV